MKAMNSSGWPPKWLFWLVGVSGVVQVILLAFFPLSAPCHWTEAGIADGYMNKYFYLLFYAVPFLLEWLFSRSPRSVLVDCFYRSPWGRAARTLLLLLAVLVTWVPGYGILLVPRLAGPEGQAAWLSPMVRGVEGALGLGLLGAVALGVAWAVCGRKTTY